jgi:hypothetical protein
MHRCKLGVLGEVEDPQSAFVGSQAITVFEQTVICFCGSYKHASLPGERFPCHDGATEIAVNWPLVQSTFRVAWSDEQAW